MTDPSPAGEKTYGRKHTPAATKVSRSLLRRGVRVTAIVAALAVGALAYATWLGNTASLIKSELDAATLLIAPIKGDISAAKPQEARDKVDRLRAHTTAAKGAAEQALWTLASNLPVVGANFSAVTEVTRSADDVATLGLAPLAKAYDSLDWNSLLPSGAGTNLAPIEAASPNVSSAAHAVRASAARLDEIDVSNLLPQVAEPITRARVQLREMTGPLDAAADASQIIPPMLGADAPRTYLLMIQNNAESRASGGIAGALAVLKLNNGKLTLGAQSSAGDVGVMSPGISVDIEQQQIYSGRLGKFMQDVNLTPDFPSAAVTAQAMWERKTGQHVDGVISIDPVALSYILDASSPVILTNADLVSLASGGLPTELSGKNVVQTLLSDVYSKIDQPSLQDAYFAGVAQEIFATLSNGTDDADSLIEAIIRGTEEGRIRVWSSQTNEQAVISNYPLSGSISGPSISPAQFGVYFNDGTGAKMDYYVKRTAQLVNACPRDGYEEVTVRITSTNTAPKDAATTLPAYVTGDGIFGVPPGSVQTNIIAYGPVQAQIESAKVDGKRTNFAPYLHSNRPVGVLAIRLAPGESKKVEYTFGKIVQHTEPSLVVTPTVQPVKDVILPSVAASCS